MKIVILQDQLRSGGTERQTIFLGRSFIARSHPVALLTFRPGGELAPAAESLKPEALQPFDCWADWFAPALTRTVARHAPDIVLCMGRMANCYGGRIKRGLRARGSSAVVLGTMRTGKRLPRLYRDSLQRVCHVIANSGDAKAILINDYSVAETKISVIHNSVIFPPPLKKLPFRGSDRQTTPVILACVGMFRSEKNQRELIEIVDRLPRELPWELRFAGDGPERKSCEALVARKNLGARVTFLGFCHDPTFLYEEADLAVLTSRSESLPNFLVEAQAHGLPVVAYDVGGVRECFIEGKSGFAIAPGDFSSFAKKLEALILDPELRREQANRAGTFARKAFSPDGQVTLYLQLFAELLARRAP